MKKFSAFFLVIVALFVFLGGCSLGPLDNSVSIVVYDAMTGRRITQFSEVTSTFGTKLVEIDSSGNKYGMIDEQGRIILANPLYSSNRDQIVVTINDDNYYDFEAFLRVDATAGGLFQENLLYYAFLVPRNLSSFGETTIQVRDSKGGALLSSGRFVLKPDSAGALANNIDKTLGGSAGNSSGVLANLVKPNYLNDIPPIDGSISADGEITVPDGVLFPLTTYEILVYGIEGYKAAAGTNFTIDRMPAGEFVVYVDELEKDLALMSVNVAGRAVSFTFNHEVDLFHPGLKNNTNSLLDILDPGVLLITEDSDGDGETTTIATSGTAVAASDVGELPDGLTIALSDDNKTIIITLTATDADLTDDLDTGDILEWDISNIFGGISVRMVGEDRSNAVDLNTKIGAAPHITTPDDTLIIVR